MDNDNKYQPFKGKSRYKRKTPKHVPGTHVRREKDQTLTPMLTSSPVTDEEIKHLHRGPIGEIIVDDYFYDLLRRLVHFGAIHESTVYSKFGIPLTIWEKKKRDHPELKMRFEQYIADRDLLIQAYANNILFDPNHPAHSQLLMHHDRQKQKREDYRLRSEELSLRKAIAIQNLEAAKLTQPNVQQVIAVLPAGQSVQDISPSKLMEMLSQPQQDPIAIEATVKETNNE